MDIKPTFMPLQKFGSSAESVGKTRYEIAPGKASHWVSASNTSF